MPVEKQDGAQGLILGGGAHLVAHGKGGEKGSEFRATHVLGVAFAVEDDDPLDPVDRRVLGARAAVSHAEGGAELVEETRLACRNCHDGRVGVRGICHKFSLWLIFR